MTQSLGVVFLVLAAHNFSVLSVLTSVTATQLKGAGGQNHLDGKGAFTCVSYTEGYTLVPGGIARLNLGSHSAASF